MKLPKLILTDIDGVWTDGGMYYDQTGNEWKKFNTSDSAGVLFAKMNSIPVGIITGEDTDIVKRRAAKLKIEDVFLGVTEKCHVLDLLCEKYNIEYKDVAYIGDDINDIAMLNLVGISACPSNAPQYIKDIVYKVTTKAGGNGAFREFVEWILLENKLLTKTINQYVIQQNNLKQ